MLNYMAKATKGAFLVSSPDHDGFVVNSSNFILDLEQAEVVPLSADDTYLAVWRMKDPDNETQYGENIDTYIRVFDSAGNFLTDEVSLAGLGIDYDNEIEDIMDVQTLSNGDAAIYMRERSSNPDNNNSQDIIYQVDSSDYSVSWDVYSWTVTDDYGNNWESTLGTQNTSNLVVNKNYTKTPNNIDENNPPNIISPDSTNVAENADITTVIYDADATDPDGDTLTYSVSGTDASYVEIDRMMVRSGY